MDVVRAVFLRRALSATSPGLDHVTRVQFSSLASPRPVSPSRYVQAGHKSMNVNVAGVCMFYSARCFSRVRDHRDESTSQLTGTFHLNANLPRALRRPPPDTFLSLLSAELLEGRACCRSRVRTRRVEVITHACIATSHSNFRTSTSSKEQR